MLLPWVLALVLLAGPERDPALVGRWFREGAPYLTLRADGTGTLAGTPIEWTSDPLNLRVTLGSEQRRFPYRLDPQALHLAAGPESMDLVRDAPGHPVARWIAGGDGLSRLLIQASWCLREGPPDAEGEKTMPDRIAFARDGTFRASAELEGELHRQRGLWRTRDQTLLLSDGEHPFVAILVEVTLHSGKVSELRAGGARYGRCR